jgi:antitoxin component HigA of HigAB toxin-antitoxin module
MIETNWMDSTLIDVAEKGDIELTNNMQSITTQAELKEKLAQIISYLLDHDFEKLLWILYRIDVDEEKAKHLLSQHLPDQAPEILADLIIQRQIKKDELKKQFNSASVNPEDEDLIL